MHGTSAYFLGMKGMFRRSVGAAALLAVAMSATAAGFLPPCDQMADSSDVAMADMPGMPGMPAAGSGQDSENAPAQDTECPLAVLGNGGSCLAAALTSSVVRAEPGLAKLMDTGKIAPEIIPSNLLGSGLFHPPKA